MALKIFISSVSKEFYSERKAIENVINNLQELFVGMEYFGGTPNSPSEYDEQKVKESDVYIGLIGYEYGSIDKKTGKSFTELEYLAAQEKNIPCLIYFKGSIKSSSKNDETDFRLLRLKEELTTKHIVQSFTNSKDLKVKFLIDFIKIVRTSLWHKANINQTSPIPVDVLHTLSKNLIEAQINSVGGDKYLSSLYVPRESVENEIMAFADYEDKFLARLENIFADLMIISKNFNLSENPVQELSEIKSVLTEADKLEICQQKLNLLKQLFFVGEVEVFIREILSIIQEKDLNRFYAYTKRLFINLKEKSFIDVSQLRELPKALFEERRDAFLNQNTSTTSIGFQEILRIFPSIHVSYGHTRTANDLINELEQLINLNFKRCLVLVDKAGSGKTNVMCNVSGKLSQKTPTFLLGGYMPLTGEYDIDFYIRQQFESQLGGNFSDWMNRTADGLKDSKKWLFIVIDGINENRDFAKFAVLFSTLLPRIQEKRIKLILSCRDVLWDFFSPVLSLYSFNDENLKLNNFDVHEWDEAINIYLSHFKIKVTFGEKAKSALKNPLLMRFFCEAHKDQDVDFIQDIRLVTVFDLYVKKLSEKITHTKNTVRSDEVIGLLTKIVDEMWINRTSVVDSVALEISLKELDEKDSIYNLVLSENIVFEEQIHPYSSKKTIKFVYDEFMEYILARNWVDKVQHSASSEQTISQIIKQAVESFFSFPTSFGALLFLDKMLKYNGHLITRIIIDVSKNENAFSNLNQFATLYAFENIAVKDIEEEVIDALEKFESVARDEIKERLAKVILKVVKENSEHPKLVKIVEKMLEIKSSDMSDSTTLKRSVEPFLTRKFTNPESNETFLTKTESSEIDDLDSLLLPPANFHYSDEIKLAAIGVLISKKQASATNLANSGMNYLGQLEIHNALDALASWDTAEDEQVILLINNHIKSKHSEFRMFCAWLLRNRYGKKPSDLLIELLTDKDTRVHEYAFKMFSERFIEEELIEKILEVIRTITLKSWHLKHLIKLLSVRDRFITDKLFEEYGSRIAETLEKIYETDNESMRLEACRALLKYADFIDINRFRAEISQDASFYIRKLSARFQKQK